jgi:phospholipase C
VDVGSKRVSRRSLLKGAAAGAVAFGVGAQLAGELSAGATDPSRVDGLRWPDSLPFPNLPPGTDTMPEIEHILVLMMENHSYDNYLGMLGRGDGFTLGANGKPTATNPYPDGSLQHAFEMPNSAQQTGRPTNEWGETHLQMSGGTCQGFVSSKSGPVAMGYWTEKELPFYYSLANTFPIGDRWFCSVPGQTYPNRRFLLGATSAGMVEDVLEQVVIPAPNGTILERLEVFGLSWKNYYSNQPSSAFLYPVDAVTALQKIVPIGEFYNDAKTGNLPHFAIIDPNFGTSSEEDPQDISEGQALAAKVINAVMSGPAWNKTLLIWNYDEHGGYYDHVAPPLAIKPDLIPPIGYESGESAYDGFGRYGFRVPAAVISPWAKADYVSSVLYDHTSILAMVERKWNLPACTWRDANANDLMDFLDFTKLTFFDPPILAQPAKSTGSPGHPGTIPPLGSVTPKT